MKILLALVLVFACATMHGQGLKSEPLFKSIKTMFYHLDSPVRMDSTYQVYRKQYKEYLTQREWDELSAAVAISYASTNNFSKTTLFMNLLQDGPTKASRYFSMANNLSRSNKEQAEYYGLKALDTAVVYADMEDVTIEEGMQPKSVIASSLMLLSGFYINDGAYVQAVNVLDRYTRYCSEKNQTGLFARKADILYKAKNYDEALKVYVMLFSKGNKGELLRNKIKAAFAGVHNGDSTQFDNYYHELNQTINKAFYDSIAKADLHIKAPDFSLKDVDGNIVQLKDFVGKTVILDFWATWCVPCRNSFPAMQMTIDKFRSDTNVVFLFIDTWEYTDIAPTAIKKLLQNDNYTFRVLMDVRNSKTKECEVVKSYKVDGVPAKFIIDRKGFIRYKLKGFNGSIEESVQELSTMIKLAS